MRYLIGLLLITGCSTGKVTNFTLNDISWGCRYSMQRMNCHNININTRYNKVKKK